jgi:diguanylate cyclase (GGDEF)-like protein
MVLAYKHQGLWLFLLIGGTGLGFNAVFRRMRIFAASLRTRVVELEVLNRVARIISGSLDRKTLFQNLATTTLSLVGDTSRFMIGLQDERGETVAYELFNKDGECYKQLVAGRGEGLSGWVMRHRQSLILGDVQAQYQVYVEDGRYNDPRFHSWLAVPLIVYDEVVGVMSVQTEGRHAYTMDHLRVLTMIADQAAVAIENSRLYQLATVDGLTGLFVRRYFDQRLVEEWDRASRYGNAFTLGLFDLDNFKKLNDTHGHQTGDQVLRSAARAVRSNMRSFDLAARYGGEEFAFILPRTTLDEAATVAERIRRDVSGTALQTELGPVRITASIGLASFPAEGVTSAAELLSRADQALYEAKDSGKNRVVRWGAPKAAPAPSEA